jgi:hypothetical protein
MANDLPVTAMFKQLVNQGYIKPVVHMEDLEFPGTLNRVPSVIGYTTPDIPIRDGVSAHAELGKRSERNIYCTSD